MRRRTRRGIDLETPRPLRFVEDVDGFVCAVLDKEGTKRLGQQIMAWHVGMMLAFVTVVLAPVAWLVALANMMLSPKVALHRVACTQHGVRLSPLYGRTEPGIEAVRDNEGTGGGVFGLGAAEEPKLLPFSEIEAIGWTDYSLWFRTEDDTEEILMECTSPEDIERLGQRIRKVWAATRESYELTDDEADRERQRLAALTRQRTAT